MRPCPCLERRASAACAPTRTRTTRAGPRPRRRRRRRRATGDRMPSAATAVHAVPSDSESFCSNIDFTVVFLLLFLVP